MIAVKAEVVYAAGPVPRINVAQYKVTVLLLGPLFLQQPLQIDGVERRLLRCLLDHFLEFLLVYLLSVLAEISQAVSSIPTCLNSLSTLDIFPGRFCRGEPIKHLVFHPGDLIHACHDFVCFLVELLVLVKLFTHFGRRLDLWQVALTSSLP